MKKIISFVLCFSMVFNLCFMNLNAVTDEITFEEIITSENDTTAEEHLTTEKETTLELDKEDISDDGIKKVLKAEGLLGLSKKQYVQYLSKNFEKTEFEEDQALMEYTGTTQEFTEKYITKNSKIIGIEETGRENDYIVYFEGKSQNLVMNMIKKLAKDHKVIHIQPNFRYYPCAVPEGYSYASATTRAYEMIEAQGAWDYATGNGVKVGVIDTGIKDDVVPINSSLSKHLGTHDPATCSWNKCKYNQHGTSVASIIGKRNTSTGGFVGLAYNCTLVSYNVLNKYDSENGKESLNTEEIVNAITRAETDGIKILNGSFGHDHTVQNDEFNRDFREAIQGYNGLFVKSSGNDTHNDDSSSDKNDFKNIPNLIIVGAVDEYDNLTEYSDYGTETVHIAAPGNVTALDRYGAAVSIGGTSFAAPMVAATAALMLEVNPNLTAAQLKNYILSSADIVPQLQGKIQGGRRLNAKKAVKSVVTAASKFRIASLDNNGVLQVKEGATNAYWAITDYGVTDFQLEGKKLGIIQGGKLKVKEGALNLYWDVVCENVKSFKMAGNTICVLTNSNTLIIYRKSGSSYTTLRSIANVTSYDITGKRIVYKQSSTDKFRVTEDNFSSDAVINFTAHSCWLSAWVMQVVNDTSFNLYRKNDSGNPRSGLNKTNARLFSSTFNRSMVSESSGLTYVYQFSGYTAKTTTQVIPANTTVHAIKTFKYKLFYIGSNENVLYYQQGTPSSSWSSIKWNVQSLMAADGYTGVITTDGTFSIIPDNGAWYVIDTNVAKAQILY